MWQHLAAPGGINLDAEPTGTGLLLRVFAVLAVLALAAYASRRFLNTRPWAPVQRGRIRILDAVPLGPQRNIYLVEVAGRVLVVGATPEAVNLLTELSPDEIDAYLTGAKDLERAAPAGFMSLLNRQLGRATGQGEGTDGR